MLSGKVSIRDNIERVRRRIGEAARRAGRDPADVQLLVVAKTRSLDEIRQVYEAGQRLMGFNRVQEAQEKIPQLPSEFVWQMIGHIQTNKAKLIPRLFRMAHSVDSVRLATALNEAISKTMDTPRFDILLEINVSGEESKYGLRPEETEAALSEIARMDGLRVCGLMTMAPFVENPERTRPVFRGLRDLRDQTRDKLLRALGEPASAIAPLDHLSMGMTNDFEIAIEEGATIVRVGTAIFEGK